MNKRLVYLTPLILALGLGLILYTAIGKDPNYLETARLNDPIPAFELSSLTDAEKVLDQESLKGEVRLLNVWATWCPSCRTEHPYLVDLKNAGVKIVGLNYKDERVAANQWLNDLGDPYEFSVYDPKGSFGFDLGVYGAPETYIVDRFGVVRYRHVGVVDQQVWQDKLKPIMDKL